MSSTNPTKDERLCDFLSKETEAGRRLLVPVGDCGRREKKKSLIKFFGKILFAAPAKDSMSPHSAIISVSHFQSPNRDRKDACISLPLIRIRADGCGGGRESISCPNEHPKIPLRIPPNFRL